METLEQIHFTAPYWVLLMPLIAAGGDILTGWIQATVNGTWDSTKMRKGLFRKSGEILVVLLAWIFDVAIVLPVDLAQLVSGYIIIMEALSVFENLDQAGVSIPFVRKWLKKAKDGIDKASETE